MHSSNIDTLSPLYKGRSKYGLPGVNRISFTTWLITVYFIVIPFEIVLAAIAGPVIRYLGVGIIAWLFLEIVSKKRIIKITWGHISICIWFFIAAISFLWTPGLSEWQKYFLIYGRNLALLLAVTSVQYSKNEFDVILKGVKIGGLLVAILLLLNPSAVGTSYISQARETIAVNNLRYDPNYMAGMFLMPVAISCFHFFQNLTSHKGKALLNGLILGLMISAALRTGSRGGFLGITVSVLFIFGYFILILKRSLFLKLFAIILSGAILVILYNNLPPVILERFSFDSLSGNVDSGANRLIIWELGWSIFKESVLFGHGLGSFSPLLSPLFRYIGAHNLYLLVLVESGILGLFFILSFLWNQLTRIMKKKDILLLSIFFGLIIICFFLDSLAAKFFWNTLMVIGIFLNIKKTQPTQWKRKAHQNVHIV